MRMLNFPNNIQIETTSRCNARCGFCPYPETSLTEPSGTMDQDLFERIVDEIACHPVDMIQPFLNNDPLMDRQIVPRLELIVRKNPGARVCITTNGFLLRSETARALAAMPLETIHISSNGLTPETYRNTMGIDAFTVLRNVNYLWDEIRRRGSRTRLVVTAILMSTNKHEVESMREYWRARGVTFYLNPLNNRAGNMSDETYRRLLPFDGEGNQSQLSSYSMSGCPALMSYMGILWNGDIITCCMDWRRAHVMGNAREDTLFNLWRGPRYRALRHLSDTGRLDEDALCRGCGENRFQIDPETARGVLSPSDSELVERLQAARKQSPELVQLGLMR
jgi:MoaA/NifB/PqqE/SkfB family radical SAM enzyme